MSTLAAHELQCNCDRCLGPGVQLLTLQRKQASRLWVDMFSAPVPPTIVRPELQGNAVAFFALPPELCKTTNEMSRLGMVGQAWRIKKHKQSVIDCMLAQCRPFGAPLKGRPQVLCCKFGGRRPDKYSDFAKVAVDRLLPTRARKTKAGIRITLGLGIIRDDSESAIDLHQWWWPAKKADACMVIQVRTGAEVAA